MTLSRICIAVTKFIFLQTKILSPAGPAHCAAAFSSEINEGGIVQCSMAGRRG